MTFEISERTRNIIANFSTINPSLLFREGNVLKTISPSKDVFAIADIQEIFPKEFAIYDLSRFLGVLSLFDKAKIEFDETSLTIKDKDRYLNYVYAAPNMIISAPNNEFKIPTTIAEFDLSSSILTDLNKALGLLKLPEVIFESNGKEIVIKATDIKNPTGDSYVCKVGTSDKTFKVVFKAEKLAKLIDANYKVQITHGDMKGKIVGITKFVTDPSNVTYFVGPEESSVYA